MRKLLFAVLSVLLFAFAIVSTAYRRETANALGSTSQFNAGSLNTYEQQVVALVNGSRTYNRDLELESIALSHPAFRAAGSVGATETANWIKQKFENFSLEAWLEPFQFYNWTLLKSPSLVIDQDRNQSTTADHVAISSFQSEHYSWPTPAGGVFADLVILPLPPAANRSQIGINPIDATVWNAIDTTGKIVLIGKEIRWNTVWEQTFVSKITTQHPAAVLYTWWYDWMSFTPPSHSSSGGRPMSQGRLNPYYWNMHIPVGFANYEEGSWIRQQEEAINVAAQFSIESVIEYGLHYNVVGKISGYENPEKLVVISSHYDTVMCSGFCDNGAGTTSTLELAEVFAEAIKKEIYKPRYTLLFVAFTAEELDLVGSVNYVKQHKNDMQNIVAVINLDCLGSDNLYVTNTDPSIGFDLDEVLTTAAQDLNVTCQKEEPGGSDQEAFRIPFAVNNWYYADWELNAGISDATPVTSSAMIISYPLSYSDEWSMGTAGWIHTAYDNSTSTETLNWIETEDLEDQVKVAALSIIRVSANTIPEFPTNIVLALIIVVAVSISLLMKKLHQRKRVLYRNSDVPTACRQKSRKCILSSHIDRIFSEYLEGVGPYWAAATPKNVYGVNLNLSLG